MLMQLFIVCVLNGSKRIVNVLEIIFESCVKSFVLMRFSTKHLSVRSLKDFDGGKIQFNKRNTVKRFIVETNRFYMEMNALP